MAAFQPRARFPIQARGLRQSRVARGSEMGAVCGIRGVAAVHAQSFKKKEKDLRCVARQVLCLPRRKRWRADFPVRLVGSSRELFYAFLFRKYLGFISYMDGGTVSLACFVSGILIQAGLAEFCCRVRAVLVRTISVDGSLIFF